MKSLVRIVVRFLLIIAISLQWKFIECVHQGYIFTAPWVFDSDSTEKVCLTLRDVDEDGRITVKLANINGVIVQQTKNIRKGCGECFDLKVPETSEREAILYIQGNFEDGYQFKDKRAVKIRHTSDIILIQTDKHIYKAGQKVQFRILHVTTGFTPSPRKIRSIWIEDHLKVKVYENKACVAEKGIISSSLQLSDKPELGNWTIFVEDPAKLLINKTFQVDEYVLPRFAVRIFIPSEIRPDFESFTWRACANYTYQEAVKGQINAKITRTSNVPNVPKQPAPPVYMKQEQIRGCLSMTVERSDLGFDRDEFRQFNLLNFNVEVTEHGTGTMLDNSLQKEVKFNPFHLYILSKRYFKPHLPYYLKVLVKDSNDEPVRQDSFTVDVKTTNIKGVEKIRFRLRMTTNNQGIAQLNIQSFQDTIQTLILEITPSSRQVYEYYGFRHSSAKSITIGKSITERLRSWSSPSDSYIKIEGPTQSQSLTCNQPSRFTVHCTGVTDDAVRSQDLTIHFQIMARNNILRQGQVLFKRNDHMKDETTSFTIALPITIEPSMSPKAEILVYYIRDDGEIVGDSEAFIVNECFDNPVGMKFTKPRSLPGVRVDLELTASPDSLCSVFMTDKSTQLLSGREFNPHKIFRIINDRPPNAPGLSADKQCTQRDPQLGVYERNKGMFGSQAAFNTIGMMTMSDLFLELNPCQPVSKIGVHGRKGFAADDEGFGIEGEDNFGDEFDEESHTAIDKRVDFPETWLWQLIPIGGNGLKAIQPVIPHTITRWTGNTFCMSEDKGLGVSPKASIISFQPVFMTFTMPYSAKLGETVPVTVSVYSYLRSCYPVAVSLKQHQEFKLISSSNEAEMCICAKESSAHKFHIEPLKLGVVNISVSVTAVSALRSAVCGDKLNIGRVSAFDSVTKPIVIKPQGAPKEKSENNWICGHGESKTYKFPSKMPADGIAGTAKIFVSVAGDLIAPTVNGMDHLVAMPTGCGEQTMITFTPMVFLLNYLKSTKQLSNHLNARAVALLQSGYQNELRWRRNDGSFSVWGQNEAQGSMWLTAFVVKSFALAKTIIFIDNNVIEVGKNWIVRNQQNGCFHNVGILIHKEMQGGIGKGDNSPQTMTLFATIALLEAGYNPLDPVIENALACANRDGNPSNLRLAMKAYATALAKKTRPAQDLLKTLIEQRSTKSGDRQHWTNGPGSSHEVNIETTAYVLLAIATLRAGHADVGMNIIRWLISQRHANGGFYSTQDTVIAIQAMETFTSQLKEWNTNMEITFTNNNMGKLTLNVDRGNRLIEQTRSIPTADTVEVTTTGHGCTLLEITIKYEVPGKHPSLAFYLDISVLRYNQPTVLHKETIHICTRFQGEKEQSNMALIEMQMVTGYEAENGQFQTLLNSNLKLKKFENNRGNLVLYFNHLSRELTCLDIVVTETLVTKHRKPAIIKVYDYYEPEKQTSKEYALLYKHSNDLDE